MKDLKETWTVNEYRGKSCFNVNIHTYMYIYIYPKFENKMVK